MEWVDGGLFGELQAHVGQLFILFSALLEIFDIVLKSKSSLVGLVLSFGSDGLLRFPYHYKLNVWQI